MQDGSSSVAEDEDALVAAEKELKAKRREFAVAKRHRELTEAVDSGWLPQGVRLVHPSNPDDGRVVVFSPEEAAEFIEPLRKILAARTPK